MNGDDGTFRYRMDWSRLTVHLADAGEDQLLTFSDIERICRGPLPASKEYPAFWSNSSGYAKHWVRAGYKVSRARCLPDQVRFIRSSANELPAPQVPEDPPPSRLQHPQPVDQACTETVVLVGCVKTKRNEPSEARDLYTSPLFARRRAYAEASQAPWFILSAEYGLVAPHECISPYDTYLADLDPPYRRVWGEWSATRLARLLGDLRGRRVEIHAGEAYVSSMRGPLSARGAHVSAPLAGLRQGEQLSWYDDVNSDRVTHDSPDLGRAAVQVAQTPDASRRAVADALLAYRVKELSDAEAEPLGGRGDAGALLATDPFAFLVAVIFDEGIVAERAWAAPLELKRRLGHLDPAVMRSQLAEVTEAVSRRPALHRYIELIPEATCLAAARVCDVYAGDASRIWADGTSVKEVDRRLREFRRIGQKKAAMAVEILLSKFGADLPGLEETDIAYDVQVRRVFLRTGIVDRDDRTAMVEAARRLNPDRPGYIDAAAWHIGREWCRPTSPMCSGCPLTDCCARRTWLGT